MISSKITVQPLSRPPRQCATGATGPALDTIPYTQQQHSSQPDISSLDTSEPTPCMYPRSQPRDTNTIRELITSSRRIEFLLPLYLGVAHFRFGLWLRLLHIGNDIAHYAAGINGPSKLSMCAMESCGETWVIANTADETNSRHREP